MDRSNVATVAIAALFVGTLVGGGLAVVTLTGAPGTTDPGATDPTTATPGDGGTLTGGDAELVGFANASAYAAYVRAGQRLGAVGGASGGGDGGAGGAPRETDAADAPRATVTAAAPGTPSAQDQSTRVGRTNVQVAGLDEPDLVKTDGTNFYYAHTRRTVVAEPEPVGTRPPGRHPPEKRTTGGTHVIDASTPADPQVRGSIDTGGRLLQTGDRLVALEGRRLVGFDVSDPGDPTEVWSREVNGSVVTARERNGTIYLVTRQAARPGTPCPVQPLGGDVSIACGDVYHPRTQIRAEATYNVLSLSAATGDVHDAVSVVGTARNTVVYMSGEGLYVTYTKTTQRAGLLGEFALTQIEDLPADVAERIREIRSYDLTPASTRREIVAALQGWFERLPPDERARRQGELGEEFERYLGAQQRNLTRTGIVRMSVQGTDLSVGPVETVPGEPLNQFSLSVHDGTLRIATTVPAAGDAESVNDLYTLAADTLDRRGAVRGMGETERVYSVRYVGETAYVVTFRRIDPFHVVDLADPDEPALVGELKLPGYSSYLHPVAEDRILGIGEEDGRVKAVLFDVSDPSDPRIADSMVLDAGWSAISRSHHAFMQDRRHGVVFLPTGEAGLLVDYTNDSLDVRTRVETDAPAERARYVGDHLYVFAGPEVIVVDETSWERTATLSLRG